MRVGLVARAEETGLSVLTNEFWRHMKPAKTLVVDMTPLNQSHVCNLDLYAGDPNITVIDSVPYPSREIRPDPIIERWLDDLDVVFTAETPYNYWLFERCRERGIKTVLQPMFEYFEYFLDGTLPLPDLFAVPSTWRYDEIPYENKILLPVPVDRRRLRFRRRAQANLLFHNGGKPSQHDRNGTLLLIEAMRRLPRQHPITAVIRTHADLPNPDPGRIVMDTTVHPHYYQSYEERFDVQVMPRKYGGLCLPLNEAASCGIPSIMSDVPPQNGLLPSEALMPAEKVGELQARARLEVFEVAIPTIVEKILELHANPELVGTLSDRANEYADSISWTTLKPRYTAALESVL